MSPTIQDPSKLKVTELREELQARGLDTKGNKPVLVKRLKKALEEELNQELPDTSIADTTTEELDSTLETSKTECKIQEDNSNAPVRTESVDSRTSQEPESEPEQTGNTDEPDEASNSAPEADNCKTDEKENEENSTLSVNKSVEKDQIDEVKSDVTAESKDVEMVEVSTEKKSESKGEKRKREHESEEQVQKRRDMPVKEDEPEIDSEKVVLSWYDSDLHLQINKESFLSAKPIHEGLFGYAWAGVRATHGISTGKVRYEVKLSDEMKWEDFTSQRRERQEKEKERYQAKEKRDKDRQKQQSKSRKSNAETENGASKKAESDEKKEKSDEKKDESDEKKNETDEKKVESQEKNDEDSEEKQEETKEKSEDLKMDVTEDDDSSKSDEKETKKSDEGEDEKMESAKDEEKKEEEQLSENAKEKSEKVEESSEKTEKAPPKAAPEPILTHIFRVGWSLAKTGLQLGEENFSYGYESTGKFVSNKDFKDFAAPYKLGDVVGAYLNITSDSLELRFTVNGDLQSEVITIPRSEIGDDSAVFIPHVLSRNFGFELNLGGKEEPWFPNPEELDDYAFVEASEDKVAGALRPNKRDECEVLMMCGLPGSGKTHWVREYLKANADKQINVIGSSHLLDRMTVHGQPLRSSYNGRWNILLDKLQRCLNRLTDIAPQRRRNYIIDQTNVFPSAQRRKLRAFEGFKRLAVVVVVGDEEQAKRQSLKEAQDGKDVPDYATLEMKANMALPTKGDLWDDIIYSDLNEEEAKAQVAKYNTEGKSAGYQPGQRKPPYRDERGRWNYSRNDYNRGGNFRDRAPQRYDRGPRGWGQPPPPGRFQRDRRPQPPMSGGRDWMRNNRGPPRPGGDRNGRDNRPQSSYNRNRTPGGSGGGRTGNWQSGGGSGYGQGSWGQQQGGGGSWGGSGGSNQVWSSEYQQQGSWNQNPWKYGGGGGSGGGGSGNQQGGYGQQGYGQNWNNYYGQYAQNWSGQGQQSAAGSNQYNQYAQWAQYAQQYAQGQNAKYANNAASAAKK